MKFVFANLRAWDAPPPFPPVQKSYQEPGIIKPVQSYPTPSKPFQGQGEGGGGLTL
jgi:hypothetical protein